jgi:hypothetical protein
LDQLADEIKQKLGEDYKLPEIPEGGELILPPTPINRNSQSLNWPLLTEEESIEFNEDENEIENNENIDTNQWGTESIIINNEEETIEQMNEEGIEIGTGWGVEGIEIDKKFLINSNKNEYENITIGKSNSEYWAENSEFPSDHIASGTIIIKNRIIQISNGYIKSKSRGYKFRSIETNFHFHF